MCSLSLDSIIQYSKVKVSTVPFQKNSAKFIERCAMYTKNGAKISSKNGLVRKWCLSQKINDVGAYKKGITWLTQCLLLLLSLDVESGVNNAVARGNRCLLDGHKSHTHILDDVSRRKGQVLHLLGVDLL